MPKTRPYVALVSLSICVLAVSFAFMNYYGQIYEPSPLLNTNMKFWTIDPTKNVTKPYLWEVDIIKGSSDNVSIFQTNVDNRAAIALRIFRSTENISSIWTTVHVRQDMRGPALDAVFRSTISLWVFPTFPYWYNPDSKNPENAFGIEINDGTNLLWYIFTDAPSQVFQLPHHRIVIMETPLNSWSLREVDIGRELEAAGWKRPDSVSFIVLLGTTWVHPGTWIGYVSGMSVEVRPRQAGTLPSSSRLAILVVDTVIITTITATMLLLQRNKAKTPSKH